MRKSFSERLGIEITTPIIQTETMCNELRNSIWNSFHTIFENRQEQWRPLAKWVAHNFRKFPVDELPVYDIRCMEWLKSYFYSLTWNRTYDLVEAVVNNYKSIVPYPTYRHDELEKFFNYVFEREMSGFRFIAGELAPISSPAEMGEILHALETTSRTRLNGAHHHLQSALSLLAKKPEPDYRNSIKESISAVESIAKILGKENSHGLSDALSELSKLTNLHGGLQAGFNKLYGYTSDENGIRHAILDEPTVGFDEAKYMAVSCSAFVNYLIAKAEASGLLNS